MNWLGSLGQIDLTPTPQMVAVIWAILYPLLVVADGFIFVQILRRKIAPRTALPIFLNLLLNAAFTPLAVTNHYLVASVIDLVLVLATAIWVIGSVWSKYRWVGLAQTPYLLWITMATMLQIQIGLAH